MRKSIALLSILTSVAFIFLFMGEATAKEKYEFIEKVVYTYDANGDNIVVANPDGSEKTVVLQPGVYGTKPRLSQNGEIVFKKYPEGLYVMNLDGSNLRRLTNSLWDDSPSWSPDGTQIVFASERGLAKINADGSGLQSILEGRSVEFTDWSPDGQWIAFSDYGGIHIIHPDGTGLRTLVSASGDAYRPRFTPDGSKIIYTRWDGTLGKRVPYIINLDGTEDHLLYSGNDPDEEVLNTTPSPDGKQLLLSAGDRRFSPTKNLYVTDLDGSNRTLIANDHFDEYAADWVRIPLKKK